MCGIRELQEQAAKQAFQITNVDMMANNFGGGGGGGAAGQEEQEEQEDQEMEDDSGDSGDQQQ